MDIDNTLKLQFFSTPLLKVWDYLLQHPEEELSDTEISARVSGVKKSAVNLALRRLAHFGLVRRTDRGRTIFNKLMESALTTRFRTVSNLLDIQPLLDELIPLSIKIVFFGSRADGSNNSKSDYDLLVVTSKRDDVHKIIRRSELSETLQVVIKTPEQMLTFDQDEPVFSKQVKEGIAVWEKE
jgi:predicted nucleotidyltransferase